MLKKIVAGNFEKKIWFSVCFCLQTRGDIKCLSETREREKEKGKKERLALEVKTVVETRKGKKERD